MPISCTYTLNHKSISEFACPSFGSVPAFSGRNQYTNDPGSTAVAKAGPLPAGSYFIIDRQSGGRFGWLWDRIEDLGARTTRSEWFALYRNDDVIDDNTFINGIQRGNFRLHPVGRFGRSDGCITLLNVDQFNKLATYLRKQPKSRIPGTAIDYYGTVTVQ